MTAMPTSSPIAELRGGRLMTPWQKWLSDLSATVASITGGATAVPDEDARVQAADAAGDAAALAARVAMLEKRIHDLEVAALGVGR